MTSIATPTPSVESGADVSAVVDSSFDSTLDGIFSGDSPADDAAPAADAQPAGDDAQAEAQPKPEDNPFGDDEDETEPERIDQDGRNAYKMSEARMQRFQTAKKFHEAVQDFAPTVEAAKQHYQRASDLSAMEADFRSGDPQHVGEFLKYWGDQSPEALGTLATQMLPYLANNNPKAIQAIESTVLNVRINRAYKDAAAATDPKVRAEKLYAAQAMDHAISGKFRGEEQLPKVDPNQDASRQQQQREQQIKQREEKFYNDRWNEWDQKFITGGQEQALQQRLDAIFTAPQIKDAYPAKALEMLRRQTEAEAKQQLGSDAEWARNREIERREIQREFSAAMRSGAKTNLEPRIKAFTDDYSARLQRVIPGIAKSLLSAQTKTVLDQNKATHQKLAAGVRVAPGGGKPAPRSVAPSIKPGQSFDDYLDEIMP